MSILVYFIFFFGVVTWEKIKIKWKKNYVWTYMFMLNFSNKELVQRHLVSWNCIPEIWINILSINQFKVLNALRARQKKIFSAKIWKIKFQFIYIFDFICVKCKILHNTFYSHELQIITWFSWLLYILTMHFISAKR